jgi:hypothetical protein
MNGIDSHVLSSFPFVNLLPNNSFGNEVSHLRDGITPFRGRPPIRLAADHQPFFLPLLRVSTQARGPGQHPFLPGHRRISALNLLVGWNIPGEAGRLKMPAPHTGPMKDPAEGHPQSLLNDEHGRVRFVDFLDVFHDCLPASVTDLRWAHTNGKALAR